MTLVHNLALIYALSVGTEESEVISVVPQCESHDAPRFLPYRLATCLMYAFGTWYILLNFIKIKEFLAACVCVSYKGWISNSLHLFDTFNMVSLRSAYRDCLFLNESSVLTAELCAGDTSPPGSKATRFGSCIQIGQRLAFELQYSHCELEIEIGKLKLLTGAECVVEGCLMIHTQRSCHEPSLRSS